MNVLTSKPMAPPMRFVAVDQQTGALTEDGVTPWRFVGTNIFWMMEQAATGSVGEKRVMGILDQVCWQRLLTHVSSVSMC